MTDSETGPTECPVCGSTAIEHWESLPSWVCTDCSSVLTAAGEAPESRKIEENTSPHHEPVEPTANNWKQSVSVKDSSESILVEVLSHVEEVTEEIGLPKDVVIQAGELVTEAWKMNFMHGRTKEDTVAAAIYAVSRKSECAVPPGVLAKKVGTDKRSIKMTYTQLSEDLKLGLDPPVPSEYINYICEGLGLPTEARTEAEKLLTEQGFTRGDPVGVAAAGVYEAVKQQSEDVTLRETASTITLTKETVWRHTTRL